MTDKGRNLDLWSDAEHSPRPATGKDAPEGGFLGVQCECCDVYSRVYLNREQTAYVGRCPRCGKRVEFLIGPEGTSSRFFRAY
jgi:ribosomal protein S27E